MRLILLAIFPIHALMGLPIARFDETLSRFEGDLAFLIDAENRQIEDVAALPKKSFSVRSTLNLGFERNPVWIRLEIENTGTEESFVIEVAQPLLHYVDFFSSDDRGGFVKLSAGRLAPLRTGLKHHKILFPVSIQKGTTKTAYLRISTKDTLVVPVTIWRQAEFSGHEMTSNLALGAFYGIIAIIFFYNFFLFLSLRDRTYIYYLLYLFFFALYRLCIDGSIYPLLEPTNAWLNWRLPLFTMAAISMFLMFFSDAFLELKARNPLLSRIVRLLALAIPFMLPFALFDAGMTIVTQLVNIVGGIGVIAIVIVSVFSLIQKNRQARFFVLGEAALLGAVAVSVLVNFGKLPANVITMNIIPVGFLIELSLLSFGLADKMTRLKNENAEISLRAERAELERTRVELEAVKTIISPHSLLNSIQSIANDIGRNPDRALEMLSDLGTEFRSLMGWAKKAEIPLEDEIKLCNAHLRIMGRRTSHRYTFKAPKNLKGLTFPPLILHTFIENAISHESRSSRSLSFSLNVEKTAAGHLKNLRFSCNGKLSGEHQGSGVGLRYVKTRLEQSYPGSYDLKETFGNRLWQVDITIMLGASEPEVR